MTSRDDFVQKKIEEYDIYYEEEKRYLLSALRQAWEGGRKETAVVLDAEMVRTLKETDTFTPILEEIKREAFLAGRKAQKKEDEEIRKK